MNSNNAKEIIFQECTRVSWSGVIHHAFLSGLSWSSLSFRAKKVNPSGMLKHVGGQWFQIQLWLAGIHAADNQFIPTVSSVFCQARHDVA